MSSWSWRLRSAWQRCEGPALALFVGLLLIAVVTGECAAREEAVYLAGFRAGAASSSGQPVRWGARTAEGTLIVVSR